MKLKKTLARSCALSVFFLGYELAAGFSFYFLECALVWMGVCLLLTLRNGFRNDPAALLRRLLGGGKQGSLLIAAAVCYLAVDLAGLAHSPAPATMWQKYRVVAGLLAVAAAVMLISDDPEALRGVRRAAAGSCAAICAMTGINYFVLRIYPILYTLRLSLRSDYNMFATAVFIGMTVGFFESLAQERAPRRRTQAFCWLAAALPVILLSGSRRILLLLPAALSLMAGSWLVVERKRRGTCGAAAALLLCVLCAGFVWGEAALYRAGMQRLSASERSTSVPGLLGEAETPLEQRYASVVGASLFAKRKVIWGLAVDELKNFQAAEWVFGKGAGENIVMYDRVAGPLDAIYPDRNKRIGALSAHNLFLADLIDGGLVKLASLVALLTITAYLALQRLLRTPLEGLSIAMVLGVCVLNSMVSNRFGLLYDRYFVIYVALLAAGAKKGGSGIETNRRDADDRASL